MSTLKTKILKESLKKAEENYNQCYHEAFQAAILRAVQLKYYPTAVAAIKDKTILKTLAAIDPNVKKALQEVQEARSQLIAHEMDQDELDQIPARTIAQQAMEEISYTEGDEEMSLWDAFLKIQENMNQVQANMDRLNTILNELNNENRYDETFFEEDFWLESLTNQNYFSNYLDILADMKRQLPAAEVEAQDEISNLEKSCDRLRWDCNGMISYAKRRLTGFG